jgi:UDP-N-acetylglucosamine--dolichyl-phosphate N-acetylglucosaminephosphotransferase
LFKLIRVTEKVVEEIEKDNSKKKFIQYESTNFTIINFYLTIVGPTKENKLTFSLLIIQSVSCFIAFLIRYQLSKLFYDK